MSPRPRTGDLTILIGAGLAMAVLTVVSFMFAPSDSSPRVAGSSYSAQDDGAKAAYLVLKELGHDVRRSFEPIAEIDVEPAHGSLLIVEPVEGPTAQDKKAVRAWLESGGVVLAFGRSAAPFLPGAEFAMGNRPRRDLHRFDAVLPGPLTSEAPYVSARIVDLPRLDPAYLPVYSSNGSVAVVAARFGSGRVVWSLDDGTVENDGIRREANVRFLANAAGAPGTRRILWDEFYHGERRSLWSYVADTPLAWGGAQIGLVALAAIAAVSRRRGPVRARFVEPRTSPLEFIDTMGALYERAGAAYAAIDAVRTRVRRRLAAAAGLSTTATDDRLAAAAAQRAGIDSARAAGALKTAADVLRRSPLADADAVRMVAELQALSADAAAARAGRSTGGSLRRWRR